MSSRRPLIAVYIVANRRHGTLYIGVTSNLVARVRAHKEGRFEGFSKTYGCDLLVWWEPFAGMVEAIQREKTMKKWPRDWKLNVIERMNPQWEDLFPALIE